MHTSMARSQEAVGPRHPSRRSAGNICCLTASVCGTDQVSLTWLWQGGNLGLASIKDNTARVYSCSTLQWAWVEKVMADPELPLPASRTEHPWWLWWPQVAATKAPPGASLVPARRARKVPSTVTLLLLSQRQENVPMAVGQCRKTPRAPQPQHPRTL